MSDFPCSAAIHRRSRSRRSRLSRHTSIAFLLPLLTATTILGCGYPEVSPITYEYAKALYSITNRQASDQLDKVKSRIAESVEQGAVSEQESAWLLAIIEDASAGDWEKASGAARRIMEDQTKKVQ